MVKYCQFTIFLFVLLLSSVAGAAPIRWEQLGGIVGYSSSSLPQSAERGTLARLTDQNDKLVIYNGTSFVDIVGLSDLGSVLSASTVAALPTTGQTGRLLRLSNGPASGSVVIFNGTDWRCLEEATERIFVATCPPYNALADDTGNDAVAIQAAINATPARGGTVSIPPGTYRITSPIILPNDGRQVILRGAGRSATLFHVPTAFAGGPGIIQLRDGGEIKPTVERIGIFFDQPDSSNIAAMTQYPPAIYAQGGGRFTIRDMQIVRAWDGIDLRGPNGGMIVQNIEMSHFNKGIQIDGALDTNFFSDIHIWVFGLSANQSAARNANATAFWIGRVDGLLMDEIFVFAGLEAYHFIGTANGSANCAQLSNVSADQTNGLIVEDGCVTMSGFYMNGVFPTGDNAVNVSGGFVSISDLQVGFGGADDDPAVLVSGGSLLLDHFRPGVGAQDAEIVRQTGGNLQLSNSYIERVDGILYTRPAINVTGGRVALIGNRLDDLSTASPGVIIETDDWHILTGNVVLGSWVNTLPANPVMLSSYGNIGIPNRGFFDTQKSVVNGSLTVGIGGSAFTRVQTAIPTWDFPNTPANDCADLTTTVTGAVAGDSVVVNPPDGSTGDDAIYTAWVPSSDVVKGRMCCISNACDPASGVFRLMVVKW